MDLVGLDIDVTNLRGRRAVHRWERTSVGDLFERLTWSYPDKTALIGAPGAHADDRFARLTYRQADELANQVAHGLLVKGWPPSSRVLLLCENSVEAVITKIGIAKAGLVAMPVNPSMAPDVLAHLIGEMQPAAAILDAEFWPNVRGQLDAVGLEVVAVIPIGGPADPVLPTFAEFVAGRPITEPDVEIHADDIWELLFTSGTTAMPKAVMLSHSAAHFAGYSFAVSLSRGVRLECDMRVGAFLPLIYHVGGHCFIVSACLAGASLVVGRKPIGTEVAAAVARESITALYAGSPQMVEAFVEALERSDTVAPDLKLMIYGWGAISTQLYKRLLQRVSMDFVALVIFGQTEAISGHRFWPVKWPDVFERTAPELNYVGVPNPILASDVVDETGASVLGTPGASGEAVYRSPVMASGYYLDEAATREAFRGGWFHSGDSVRVDGQGLRVMVDRFKDIVKSGGENVSSQRVEAALQAHPAVARAAVVGLPHVHWGEAVTAFVIRRPEVATSEPELLAHCRQCLAGFETPKAVRFVDALPVTVGGKVLKYKLRQEHVDFYVTTP